MTAIMWFEAILTSFAMTGIIAIRYALTSGAFAYATRLLRPGLYRGLERQIGREIGWSLLSATIYGVPAGLVMWGWLSLGWTKISTDWSTLPLWWHPLSLLIYLFLHDSWFYWTHRAMHEPKLFRLMHKVHHDSRPPTAWAAMSFHPTEALSGAVLIPLLVFFIPINIVMLGLVLAIMTFCGVANHIGWEIWPKTWVQGGAGSWLITASHHHRHHKDYGCNYGLYFRVWDKICGTDKGISEFTDNRGGAVTGAILARGSTPGQT
jgi:Delta7-sterol 5-desaturase